MGFNSDAMYNMGGRIEDYLVYGANSLKIRTRMDSVFNVPLFPFGSVGRDDTPCFSTKGIQDVVHHCNTPTLFAALLSKAKKYADNHPEQPKLIAINAWNERMKGSYLLPDMLNEYGYLDALSNVIGRKI